MLLLASPAFALDVIPNLKIFGGDTRAAYGNGVNPTICIVDDLDEESAMAQDTRNGVAVLTGGLRQFVENVTNINTTFCTAADTPFDCCTGNGTGTCEDNKLIIFEVSGVIEDFEDWHLDDDYITIAGQTAPSPGISLHGVHLFAEGNHTLLQHFRIRAGDNTAGASGQTRNAIESSGTYNILDHMTFSWAPDTVASMTGDYSTISNSIVSEGLRYSIHDETLGEQHSSSLNITGSGQQPAGVINNLIAHGMWRNPQVHGNDQKILVANNITYDGGQYNYQSYNDGKTASDYNIVGNISIGGLDSSSGVQDKYPYFLSLQNAGTDIYLDDNKVCDEYGGTCDTQTGPTDWDVVQCTGGDCSTIITNNRSATVAFAYPTGYTPMASTAVEAYVLANVGARPDDRDVVDARIVADVIEAGGARAGLIDTIEYANADCTAEYYVGAQVVNCCTGNETGTCEQNAETGWPTLAANTDTHTDISATPNADDDSDGYTNLEEWIHDFATIVEGDKPEAQNTIPADNATGINIHLSATWYHSTLVDSVDVWLDEGACDGEPVEGIDSNDDADMTYSMSGLLAVDTSYCLTLRSNYEGTTGDYQQFDFTTSPASGGALTITYCVDGAITITPAAGGTVITY